MNRAEQALDEMRSRLDRTEEERKKFEAWIAAECAEMELARFGFGYARTAVDCMWMDWAKKSGLLEIHALAK